jgi:anaerobic dimethyl sulfoxide reductase subunit A
MDRKALLDLINPQRRNFLKTAAVGVSAGGLLRYGLLEREAQAVSVEPQPADEPITTMVTACDHNCGGRHMLVAHKKGDVIVRLSSDDGSHQAGGAFGLDSEAQPQLRACLRGRAYRSRVYSPERLLHPMLRVGERGQGRFKRVSWDQALDFVAKKMLELKARYGPTAILDQAYAGASFGVLHKSDQLEGLQARFLGMFGCRTSSWSVPSNQGTAFSSRTTFGTLEDGNEDDAYAHAKLIILWGWNPAYTFHGGNTFYYLRLAKQRGCRFVVVDPQYTDSAAAYDAWWIPVRPNTDAAMMAGMAQHIFSQGLQDQRFIDRFCQGMDPGTMPAWARGEESFRDYILGTRDGTPKTPEWAEAICGVAAADIRKLAELYARTKPAALKASWAPARASHGEQYSRMAAALQAMTGNIGILGGCAEGVGKAWTPEAVAYPHDQYANVWYASIKSDRWAHCVLNYPDVKREEIGCWPREDALDGRIPNIRAIFWQGSDWLNQLSHINKQLEALRKLELVVCLDSTITPSGQWADVLLPIATHFERHDVALPWYKGHYYIHRPKVIEPLGESKTDFQVYTELAYRLGTLDPSLEDFGARYNPKARRDYFHQPDAVDEAYLADWWQQKVMARQGVAMGWEEFKRRGVYRFRFDRPRVAFRAQIEQGQPFATPSGKIEIYSTELARITDWTKTQYGQPIPPIPRWLEPFESLNHPGSRDFPFHMVTPHPRWRTHSIFHNIPWLRETYQQELTMHAGDAERLGLKTGDVAEVWNGRGRVVVPVYTTERCMPGVVVLHEGAWMDRDAQGTDRAGNPDFLTLDQPSPAGAFAYNTILVNVRKTTLGHRPGWDERSTARSFIFRRDT